MDQRKFALSRLKPRKNLYVCTIGTTSRQRAINLVWGYLMAINYLVWQLQADQ